MSLSTSTPSTSTRILYSTLLDHINRISPFLQLVHQSILMAPSQHTSIRKWDHPSIRPTIIHRPDPLTLPHHQPHSPCMRMSLCTSAVKTPIYDISNGTCRAIQASVLQISRIPYNLSTCTIRAPSRCLMLSPVLPPCQLPILLLRLITCSMSIHPRYIQNFQIRNPTG